jgi:hypothetical protein
MIFAEAGQSLPVNSGKLLVDCNTNALSHSSLMHHVIEIRIKFPNGQELCGKWNAIHTSDLVL